MAWVPKGADVQDLMAQWGALECPDCSRRFGVVVEIGTTASETRRKKFEEAHEWCGLSDEFRAWCEAEPKDMPRAWEAYMASLKATP
jgi:hypothetical protein